MATYYVSLTGSDATGDGTNPSTPYRTFDAAEGAMSAGDTLMVGDGVWSSSDMAATFADYFYTTKPISIKAINSGQVTLNSAGTYTMRFNGDLTAFPVVLEGLTLGYEGTNVPTAGFFINNSGASAATVTIKDCTVGLCILGTVYDTSAGGTVLTLDNHTYLADQGSDIGSFDVNDASCFIYSLTLGANDVLSIEGGGCNITNRRNSSPLFNIKATAAGASVSVSDFNGSIAVDSSAGANGFVFVQSLNVDDAVIRDCNLVMTSASTQASGQLAVIDCDSASLTAHRGVIKNITGSNGCYGGFFARIGHDGSSAGDNRCNDGVVFNCDFAGSQKFRNNVGHGIFFGYCQNGNSFGNKISQVGLGLLVKSCLGGGHFANKVSRFGRTSDGSGSALQSKGNSGAKFYGNTIEINGDCYGAGFIGNDDAGVGAVYVNNTGVECESNIYQAVVTAPAATNYSTLNNASQDVTFKKNAYLGTTYLSATPFFDGTSNVSLASWESAEEVDLVSEDAAASLVTAGGGPGEQAIISHNIIKH